MENSTITRARREGYSRTGACSRGSWDRDALLPRLDQIRKELKPYGGTAKILKVTEKYPFRGEEKSHTYWAIFAKYTPEYYEAKNREREEQKWENRMNELAKFVGELSEKEISFVKNLLGK